MSADPTLTKIINTNDFQLHRKPLFQNLEKLLGAKVISYVASPMHPLSGIMSQDIIHFEEILRTTAGATEGYLIINSPGGDGNVAEKIITMCRQRFTKSFNVIVPNFAKSAATMIALGSDKILMGYLAELGPIDPQLGNPMGGFIPARSFIDGLEMIRGKVKSGDPVQMYLPMLAQIRPEILAQCQSAIDGSREFAEKWLKECMLKGNPAQAAEVAKRLSEGQQYKSHGKVIDFNEAHDVLKLNVEKIDPNSELWTNIWELYCREMVVLQSLQPQGAVKLFESEAVSLTMNIQINLVHKEPQRLVPLLQGRPEPEMELVLKPRKHEEQMPCIPNQPKPETQAPAPAPNPPNESPPT
jgi:ClpP class serine protease